jgi:hypothetical protein
MLIAILMMAYSYHLSIANFDSCQEQCEKKFYQTYPSGNKDIKNINLTTLNNVKLPTQTLNTTLNII